MTIYIDDSGTSPENAVAVAAGWIAHTDSWVDFHDDWDKARDHPYKEPIRCHAKPFNHSRGALPSLYFSS
jgi:hypothetical protein